MAACPAGVLKAQNFEGQPFRLGDTELIPEIRLDYVTVDNTFRTADDPTESTGFLVSPSVMWKADRRLLELSATYRGQYASYSESILNFTDHELELRVSAAPGSRHRTFAEFNFSQEHEDIGTGQTLFNTGVDDQIVETGVSLQLGYAFGAASAKGNVGGGFLVGSTSYNDVGTLTDGDDNSVVRPYAFFSYRLSPDTRLRTEIRAANRDYDADNRDRSELTYLVGLDLAATDRTGGTLLVGVTDADYDQAGISSTNQVVANINLYYKPRSTSRFDIRFNRDLDTVDDDPDGSGESIVDTARLRWRQEWTRRFSTTLNLERVQRDRECPNVDTTTDTLGLEFGVNIRRWLSVGAGVGTDHRSADACDPTEEPGIRDYDRTTIGVHLTATL